MSVAIGIPQPAERGGDRQRRLARRGQLPDQHLALDLQPDDEEEDGHHPLAAPLSQARKVTTSPHDPTEPCDVHAY
jgi:hypothetical protein